MKHESDDLRQVQSLLRDYLRPLGMLCEAGPLRVCREMVSGLLFSGSLQLTNAARLFTTNSHQLHKAVERMGAHLADEAWDHRDWAAAVLHRLAEAVEDDDLLPLDGTELAKPYARHMQYLCTVKDASRPGDPLVSGYWAWGAHHWGIEHQTLCPLMLRPWSTRQPRFMSENDLILRWMWTLREATAGRGIWLIDRGGDRPEILSGLLRVQKRWIVRLREDRPLIGPDGSRRSAGAWAQWALANRNVRGNAVTLAVSLPPEDVPQYKTADGPAPSLHLVVPIYSFIRNNKPDRWVLLTCGLIGYQTGPRQVRYEYALRWRAEDGKRLAGQVWHVEKFMVRSMAAVERLLWCVCLAGGFLAELMRQEPQLCENLEQEVLYWDDDVVLPVYRLARGLQMLNQRHGPATLAVNA